MAKREDWKINEKCDGGMGRQMDGNMEDNNKGRVVELEDEGIGMKVNESVRGHGKGRWKE